MNSFRILLFWAYYLLENDFNVIDIYATRDKMQLYESSGLSLTPESSTRALKWTRDSIKTLYPESHIIFYAFPKVTNKRIFQQKNVHETLW
jgi:hypothetical protein